MHNLAFETHEHRARLEGGGRFLFVFLKAGEGLELAVVQLDPLKALVALVEELNDVVEHVCAVSCVRVLAGGPVAFQFA